MPYSSDDEHDEDDRPVISTYVTRLVTNDRRPTPQKNDENLLDRFQSSSSFQRSVDSWAQLHQKSLMVLGDNYDDEHFEDEDVRDLPLPPAVRPPSRAASTPARVPSLIRSASPPTSRPRSPSPPSVPMRPTFTATSASADNNFRSSTYEQKPLDSQKRQSKWEVRLPQLLSVPVGPDRQSLEKTRRHTTEIIYQKANAKSEDFYLSKSNGFAAEERRTINPLVKQLRQKFDRMAETSSVTVRKPPVLRRVLSMTGSATTTPHEWAVKPADALLPRRPAQEIKTSRTNSNATLSNGRHPRARHGPPVSFPKQYFPPPSTLSVVKQLIDSGATLIYDSADRQANAPATTNAIPTLNDRMKSLEGSEAMLTGRQMSSNVDEDDYATITPQLRQETIDDNDPSEASSNPPSAVHQSPVAEDAEYYAVFDIKP